MSKSKPVPLSTRATTAATAARALDAMAAEWLDARAACDANRLRAADAALGAAVDSYRRARGKLDKAVRQIEKRGEALPSWYCDTCGGYCRDESSEPDDARRTA